MVLDDDDKGEITFKSKNYRIKIPNPIKPIIEELYAKIGIENR